MKEHMKHLAQNLRRRRISAGMTQNDLAEKSGVRMMNISRYERGAVRNPPMTIIQSLATALGCSIPDLIEPETGKNALMDLKPVNPTMQQWLRDDPLGQSATDEEREILERMHFTGGDAQAYQLLLMAIRRKLELERG
jgi:transcriptional regulator with XRE-family HTH domain